jgi:hypothetical protein
MDGLHLWPSGTNVAGGMTTTGYCLETVGGDCVQIHYQLPEEYAGAITQSCDPFILEAIFPAMRSGQNLISHGPVSPSLIRNLEEFQSVWHSWKPNLYKQVEIITEDEREHLPTSSNAVMAFSGGVDSCFTAWRHTHGLAGRRSLNLKAGIMIHGFDIPVRHRETFQNAATRSRLILGSVGIDLIKMIHNTKALRINTTDNHATILASCLMLLQEGFNTGLIPNSISYYNLLETGQLPFGSSPLTDPMLSSDSFRIVPDGTGETRFDKIAAIAGWPEAMQNLRVCLSKEGKLRDMNCCRCEKCVRNILVFRVLGLDLPPCFEEDVSISQILSLRYGYPVFGTYHDMFGRQARLRHVSGFWLTALKINFWKNRLRNSISQSLHLKKHERG